MARIQVKFGVVTRTSNQGNDYQLIEMRTTNQQGELKELPDLRMTPFSARLMLEHLPELCGAIQEGERLKATGDPAPQTLHTRPAGEPEDSYQREVVGPTGENPQPQSLPQAQTEGERLPF